MSVKATGPLRRLVSLAWDGVCSTSSQGLSIANTLKNARFCVSVASALDLRQPSPAAQQSRPNTCTNATTTPCGLFFSAAGPDQRLHYTFGTRGMATSPPGADIAQRVLAADPSDLSEVLPLLANLDPAGLPSVARAAAVASITDRTFQDTLVDAAVRGLPSLAAADLCSVVESLAELRAYSVAFKDATADQVLARLNEFSGDMLGHTLRAFGSMQYYDDELLEGVVAHMAAAPEKFSAENIADVVYAFSKCGFCHPDLVTVVERAAEVLLEEAALDRGEAIASIVDAYSRVGCSEPDVLDALVARIAAAPEGLSGEALSKVVVATIRLGCEDERLLVTLLDSIVTKLGDLSPKAVVKVMCALGELGVAHQGLLDAVTDRLIPERLSEFHPAGLSDLVDSLNKLGYYNSKFMALLQKQGLSVAEGASSSVQQPATA